ncbi:hypothetical protein [Nocardia rhizosphaerihabitans]|uniref:RiboL-PSP-HEPN domain-containing protein n=1 Tax=Nocardia rhizosphaerihabitans TaxID=1691570 RepID=A0ABQ2L5R0_9NOCA|nr:hypothetical protein [Nocardia rhizosphaerihabitans]GGO01429.1 hypothetical protein GCM10011610_71200 [Nocardia rhizosphaerihabitans]
MGGNDGFDSTFALRPRPSRADVDHFWSADPAPDDLADIFFGPDPGTGCPFDRIEFIVFRGHMCSAVFLARAVESAALPALDQVDAKAFDTEQSWPEWRGSAELDLVRSDGRAAIEDAQAMARGAACLTAAAALESLTADLLPDHLAAPGGGLHRTFVRLLDWIGIDPATRADVVKCIDVVRQRRNDYAHALTGSYWASPGNRPHTSFDLETYLDTMHRVGAVAVWLESALP